MQSFKPALINKSPIPRILWLVLLCYAVIYIVWGSTYYFIKLSVSSIPPGWVVGLRFFCGGVVMLACCALTGRWVRFPTGREWLTLSFLGVCLLLGGNLLVTIAEKRVDSYLAALIISCTPIAVAIFNRILFRIKLPFFNTIGIGIGICGVALLLYDGRGLTFSPSILLLLLALFLWSFATCVSKRLVHYPDVFVDSSLQMIVAGTICCCVAPISEGVSWLPAVQVPSLIGVSYLAIVGSLAFAAYNYLLLVEPPQRISSYALVNPFVATVIGVALAHEKPVAGLWVSLCAITVGVVFLVYGKGITGLFSRKKAGTAN